MKTIFLTTILFLTSCRQEDSYIKKLLPTGVSEIKEYYQDRGLSGDFTRLLKAKATQEDYEVIAQKLGMTEKYSDYIETRKINLRKPKSNSLPEWWNEPMNNSDFYYIRDVKKEYERRVKWKDGWLYIATEAW